MSSYIESIEETLKYALSEFEELKRLYSEAEQQLIIPQELKFKSLDCLMRYRSVLDYLAQQIIADYCSDREISTRRIYFPVVGLDKGSDGLNSTIKKNLKIEAASLPEKLLQAIDWVQHYNSNTWLSGLRILTNKSKHTELCFQSFDEFKSLLILVDGHPRMQFGDRGFGKLILEEKATLLLKGSQVEKAIRGPQEIDVNTELLFDADEGITLVKSACICLAFNAFKELSALSLISSVASHVPIIAHKILNEVMNKKVSIPNQNDSRNI